MKTSSHLPWEPTGGEAEAHDNRREHSRASVEGREMACGFWEAFFGKYHRDLDRPVGGRAKLRRGGMGERLKPAVLKTVSLERGSGVRIPLPPPHY